MVAPSASNGNWLWLDQGEEEISKGPQGTHRPEWRRQRTRLRKQQEQRGRDSITDKSASHNPWDEYTIGDLRIR